MWELAQTNRIQNLYSSLLMQIHRIRLLKVKAYFTFFGQDLILKNNEKGLRCQPWDVICLGWGTGDVIPALHKLHLYQSQR